MTHLDDMYEETERIHFGWVGRFVLWFLVAALCLLCSACVGGPIKRTIDKEVGVICYYTATAMSCLPIQILKRGHKTDEAHTQSGNERSQDENASPAGR